MSPKKLIPWAPVILWMMLIFLFSSMEAAESNEMSTGISEFILKTLSKIFVDAELTAKNFNFLIRKGAHFLTYFVLGLLILNAVKRSGFQGYKSILSALLMCILYAISDEVHQLFVPGRGGQVRDVIIDSAGSGFGIGIYWIITRFKSHHKYKNRES